MEPKGTSLTEYSSAVPDTSATKDPIARAAVPSALTQDDGAPDVSQFIAQQCFFYMFR